MITGAMHRLGISLAVTGTLQKTQPYIRGTGLFVAENAAAPQRANIKRQQGSHWAKGKMEKHS
jgi:hypothetical protein